MKYYFNMHLGGICYPDKSGRSFASAEMARQYAVNCARTCMMEGTDAQKGLIRHITIEVSDHHGYSDVVLFSDVLAGRKNPRETLEKAAGGFGMG